MDDGTGKGRAGEEVGFERLCPIVDEGVAHLSDDGGRVLALEFCARETVRGGELREQIGRTESGLNDTDLCRCRGRPREGTPVVHHKPSANHVRTAIYGTSLRDVSFNLQYATSKQKKNAPPMESEANYSVRPGPVYSSLDVRGHPGS